MRQRISNAKKRKARIRKDKLMRKKYWKEFSLQQNLVWKSLSKNKREIFKLPNGNRISWLRLEILKMQSKLAVAIRSRETDEVIRVIKYILRNKYTHYWATYRTISSKGSKSKGIPDKHRPVTQIEYENLRKQLWQIIKKPTEYKASPLKRIWLPKPNSDEFRPISVPSYIDRALQHLYLIVLDVIHEEFSETDSYGFRPFRSPGWAAKAVTLAIWQRKGFGAPKFAIELDIRKCFDSISQSFIIELLTNYKFENTNIEIIPKNIIENWLNSGYIDIKGTLSPKNQIIPTLAGIPQGGPISPTIANMVLNGIQEEIESINKFVPDKEFKKKIWVKPDDIISWRFEEKEVLRTEGLDSNNYQRVGNDLRKLGYNPPKAMALNFLNGTWPHSRNGWSYKVINKDSLMNERKDLLNNSWIRLFRFADDCIVLLNDEQAIPKVLEKGKTFLSVRGLEFNFKKVYVRNLHKGDTFQFVGYKFSVIKNHNVWKVYNYPPETKIQKLKEKIDKLYLKYKYRPYVAYYTVNAVLRGWCGFYATGNSSDAFKNLKHWLWNRTFKFWKSYYKYRSKYRIKSQRQKKKLLAFDIVTQCQKRIPRIDDPNKMKRWWIVPYEFDPTKKWTKSNEFYDLLNPAEIKVSTPSIITNLSAFFPDDRIKLEEKAIYWKNGLIQKLLKNSKGQCKLCNCSLLTDDIDIEIHHIQPFEYGGTAKFTNIAALCKECHLIVSNAVKSKDLDLIKALEASKVLKNVHDIIATNVVTPGNTPD